MTKGDRDPGLTTLDVLGFVFLGAVDGLNICSLSLLTLFVSLMYTAKASRRTIVVWGLVYVVSVFASYFLLGLGMLKVQTNDTLLFELRGERLRGDYVLRLP